MPRAIWTGAITFGLVHIPVRLVTAVKDTSPEFHMLDSKTGQRIHYQTVNEDGQEVEREQIVKGQEVESGEYVAVEPEELSALAPEKSASLEIEAFVDIAGIDPIYYDKPYYLMPAEAAARPYKLLLAAMEKAKKAGIARFVMHEREHLTAIRPLHGMLCMVTMRFAEEIAPVEDLGLDLKSAKPDKAELEVALQLVEAMTKGFDPEAYTSEYAQSVRDLVRAKARGEKFVVPAREGEQIETKGLVDALRKSLERVESK